MKYLAWLFYHNCNSLFDESSKILLHFMSDFLLWRSGILRAGLGTDSDRNEVNLRERIQGAKLKLRAKPALQPGCCPAPVH